ncbi:fimbria/pilus outer membrane usher protein [Aurantiacibacter zhengii]|nr:fimbria/pilus outer membrane usher protein [Aurantiacibacter zhengii]
MLLLSNAVAPSVVSAQSVPPEQGGPAIEDRAEQPAPTQLLLPLVRGGRVYGDVLVDLYLDGRILYNRASLIEKLEPLLSPDGYALFEENLIDRPKLTPQDVAAAGIDLRYNSSQLEISVERIDGSLAVLQSLGFDRVADEVPITLEPSGTSAYLNVFGDFGVDNFGSPLAPGILFDGALRARDIVLEFEGGYDENIAGGSGFYRRSVRAIYDEPEESRRWSAGDVQVAGLSQLGGIFLGGIGVQKGRRVFNDSGPITELGGQQILLERDATLEVLIDGRQVDLLQLTAGPYDLAQLRAQYGGRNAQLFVTDAAGRRQITSFDTFLDPNALAPGETEYGAAIGFIPVGFGINPTYSSDPALSAYYRRGISNRFTVGGAVQASQDVQVIGTEMIVSPRSIPGRFELGLAASLGQGTGYAAEIRYSHQFENSLGSGQISLNGEYRNANFVTVNDGIFFNRADSFFLNGNFSQRIDERSSIVVGANWFERGGTRANRSIFADFVRSTRRFRFSVGVEYGDDFFRRNFGVRATISIPLGRSVRADANYSSRRDDARASISKGFENTVGSWGYDVIMRSSQGIQGVEASASYVANRFFARGFVASSGNGIGNITDARSARLQIGTALAFADGVVGIGRPISDSFVLARANSDLEGPRATLGRTLGAGRSEALSGPLGAALNGNLSSYNRQSIIYDLADAPAGVDIGTGVETVLPPYRSGYSIVIGSGASVTAIGFLSYPDGRAELLSGTVMSIDDAEFVDQPFFTNSTGRFAIVGLRPGYTYQIDLFGAEASFTVEVPDNSDPILQLNEIYITPEGGEEE